MPFVPVPKDLTRVKTKVALNLTKRQLICFSIAGAIGMISGSDATTAQLQMVGFLDSPSER